MSESNRTLQAAIFRVGNELFAIDIRHIREITRMEKITKVPQMPSFVEGVIDLRGQIIPVVDLRKRLDTIVSETKKQTRIIISRVGKQQMGLIVDEVSDVWEIESSNIDQAPRVGDSFRVDFLSGILKRDQKIVFFLDYNALLSTEEKARVESVSAKGRKKKS